MRNTTANGVRTVFALAVILTSVLLSQAAVAGDLYSLDMQILTATPSALPAQITVNIYEGEGVDPSKLKGTSQATFDGSGLSGLSCDAVACITGASLENGNVVVSYTADGWDNGRFKTWATFEVIVAGSATTLSLHTSCSQTLYVDRPYAGDPAGTFYITAGTGDCFIGPNDCPPDNKLYWLTGEFRVPCTNSGPITFNVYKNDNDLKASATADFDGGGLVNISNDFAALLDGAYVDGNDLVVDFTAYGYRDNGEFESNSRFEIVTPCGSYYLDQHTSCSVPIYLNTPQAASPGGVVTYTDGCGGCIETGEPPVDCPFDDKLYWMAGEFRVACSAPADLTFRVFEKDHWDQPEGTATAYFDGTSLTGVSNDLVALLMGARVEGGYLVINYEAFGFDNDKFKSETSLEITVSGCGTFRLVKLHTSCSRPIPIGEPIAMSPSGTTTILDICGCEDGVVPTETMNWGDVKSLFR